MKRVIDGKLYDTDEAERIATHCPNADRQDFRYLRERLFRTPNGRYFIHGEGGPMTKYAQSTGDGKSGSAEIRPLSADAALQWCEKHGVDGEIVAEEFSDQIEPA